MSNKVKKFRKTFAIMSTFVFAFMTAGVLTFVEPKLPIVLFLFAFYVIQLAGIFNDRVLKAMVKSTPVYDEWFGEDSHDG